MNVTSTSGSLAFFETANGQPYRRQLDADGNRIRKSGSMPPATPLSPQPNIAFTNQNWNRTIQSTKYSFGLGADGGLRRSVDAERDARHRLSLSQHRRLDLYMTNPIGASLKNRNVSQEIRIGIRYMAD